MELYLMQHGTCLSKEIDPDQPLSPVGRDQIDRSAAAIRRLGLGFDVVVASPKQRAVQTAEIVLSALGRDSARLVVSESVKAMQSPETGMEFLRELNAESVLIAGHLPNLEKLASQLVCGKPTLKFGIENGGLMRLDIGSLPTRQATLRWMLSPMQLQIIAGS